MTVTCSAWAAFGLADGEAAGVEAAVAVELAVVFEAAGEETASCTVAMFAVRNSAPNKIGNFFMELFVDLVFKVVIGWLVVAFAIWTKPVKAAALHKLRTAIQRSGLTITPRENAAEFVLGEGGRRVLENASKKKRRLNPLRSQSRNWRKLFEESRNGDERNSWRMIVAARGNHCDHANVISSIRVPMNPLVQSWRSAQGQRPKKSQAKESSDNGTVAPAASHWRRASVRSATLATLFCGVTLAMRRPVPFCRPTHERCR